MRALRLGLWFLPAALAAGLAAVFLAGATAALSGRLGTPMIELPTPTPAPVAAAPSGVLRVVALGDSLTRGTGDPAGGGYPERVAAALRRSGRRVEVTNLAIDGYETEDLVGKLAQAETASALSSAALVLVSIGGNDLTHASRGLGAPGGESAGAGPVAGTGPLGGALLSTRANLGTVLRAIRERNAAAPIRLVGLYNPLGEASASISPVPRQMLLMWNLALEESVLQVPGAVLVPVADLFEARPDRISSDRFHPGPEGYDEIAARVVSTLPKALAGGV